MKSSPPSPEATAATIRETIHGAPRERLGLLVALAALGAVPVFSYAVRAAGGVPPSPEVRFTQAQGTWSGPTTIVSSPWRPRFPGAQTEQLVGYRGMDGYSIEVFGAAYALQRQGAELVGSESSVVGDGGYRMREGGRVATAAGLFQEVTGTDPAGGKFLIWFQYRIGGRSFVIPVAEQLWYGMASIAGEPASSIIAVRAPCDTTSCEQARARIEDLVTKAPVTVASGARNAIAATRPEKNTATLKGAGA